MVIGNRFRLVQPRTLFPSPQALFAGKTPLLAESLVQTLCWMPILAVGPENGPSGGQHDSTANNP